MMVDGRNTRGRFTADILLKAATGVFAERGYDAVDRNRWPVDGWPIGKLHSTIKELCT
jgi:hypothetical protein